MIILADLRGESWQMEVTHFLCAPINGVVNGSGHRANLTQSRYDGILQSNRNNAQSMPDLRNIPDELPVPVAEMKKSESELSPGSHYEIYTKFEAFPKPTCQLMPNYGGLWGTGETNHPSEFTAIPANVRMASLQQLVCAFSSVAILTSQSANSLGGPRLTHGLSQQELMDDDDVLEKLIPDDVIDELFGCHSRNPMSPERKLFHI